MPLKPSRVPLFSLIGLTGLALVGFAIEATVPTAEAAPPPHAAAKNGPPGLAKNRFLGSHPLVGSPATGYCYIDVPHVHDYVPDRPAVFREVGDEYVFTGDPVPFGYDGAKTVFYGHHPVPVPVEVAAAAPPTFCFIKGPHYHDYPQPEAPGFKQKDSAVFYVGPIPPEVAQERPQAERAVEIEYQPYVALRPQVNVTPPPEWQGAVWVPPPSQPGVVAPPQPQLVVAPPQPVFVAPPQPVVVAPPQPQLVVAPPQPQLVVAPPQPQLVVAPPQPQVVVAPPQPRVIVAAPAAPSVVVTAPHPAVVVVPPHPPSVVIGVPGPPGVIFYGGPGYGPGRGHGYGHGGWKGGHGGWKGGHH